MGWKGKRMDRRKFMAGCLGGGLGLPLLAQAGGAQAQAGLSKIIFPFAAGAGGDTLCRLIAQEMAPALQRTIVVENRTGGDGLIGIKAVKGASPDGNMVLVTTGPTMYLLPMVETTPSFDTAKDFMPVSLLARFEFAVVIGPAIDAADFKSFVAWLKAHPDKTSFGVPSNGTIPHFMGSKLEKDLGIPLDPRALSRQAPDPQRSHRRPSVVRHRDIGRCAAAAPRQGREDHRGPRARNVRPSRPRSRR
jgi:tripartite-type tricarboxylate transporter receptor subunit TctC